MMKPIGQLGQKIAKTCAGPRSRYEIELIKDWREIARAPLYNWCEPLALSFPKHKERHAGTLKLAVLSGFTLEVQQLSPQIIERINLYFGYPMVERVSLQQRMKLSTKHKESIEQTQKVVPISMPDDANIKDQNLKQSLQRLRALVKQRDF